MTITPAGYVFFGTILFGILLMVGVNRRWKEKGEALGCLGNAYFGIIVVSITMLFVGGMALGVQSVHQMVSFPKYEATIVSFESEWEEFDREDTDGTRYTEDVLMHTPMLEFTDDNGQLITVPGDIRSGAEPVIGKRITIAYEDGKVNMVTPAAFGLLTGLAVIVMILGYIFVSIICYVLGIKPKWLDVFGTVVFSVVIFGGMLFMFGAMVYGVFKYFQPGSDMPLWAMLVCAFFALMLALAFLGIFTGKTEE